MQDGHRWTVAGQGLSQWGHGGPVGAKSGRGTSAPQAWHLALLRIKLRRTCNSRPQSHCTVITSELSFMLYLGLCWNHSLSMTTP